MSRPLCDDRVHVRLNNWQEHGRAVAYFHEVLTSTSRKMKFFKQEN